jgi:hypothetical protein
VEAMRAGLAKEFMFEGGKIFLDKHFAQFYTWLSKSTAISTGTQFS